MAFTIYLAGCCGWQSTGTLKARLLAVLSAMIVMPVEWTKVLKTLLFSLAYPTYTADEVYYAAILR